ncbi:DNA polymerase III subunit [bacterium]|nr:DNA polymerase III subunit [bacterium]
MFADIIGHEGPIRILKRAAFSGRVPNAYLFVGQPHVGRRTVALQLAKALNCERRTQFASADELDCCDECDNCRAFDRERHPDLMVVRPTLSLKGDDDLMQEAEENGEGEQAPDFIEIEGAMIRTGQIEALIEHTYLKRVQARHKIYLVISAETMNEAAQNRLLKTLEEPPPNTLLILTSANLGALLPTTISRCSVVNFEGVPSAEGEARLQERRPDMAPEQLHSLVALSGGRVGWAISMLQHPEVLQIRGDLLDLCVALPQTSMLECLRRGEQLMDAAERWWVATVEGEVGERALKARRDRVLRTRMREVLDVLVSWFRDLIVAHGDPDSPHLINRDRRDDLRRLAPGYQVEKCRRVCAYLEDMKAQLRQNANLRLATEIMALRLISAT